MAPYFFLVFVVMLGPRYETGFSCRKLQFGSAHSTQSARSKSFPGHTFASKHSYWKRLRNGLNVLDIFHRAKPKLGPLGLTPCWGQSRQRLGSDAAALHFCFWGGTTLFPVLVVMFPEGTFGFPCGFSPFRMEHKGARCMRRLPRCHRV